MTRESHKKEGLSLSLIHQKGPSFLSRWSHLHFAVVHSINCQISDHFNWPFRRYPKLKTVFMNKLQFVSLPISLSISLDVFSFPSSVCKARTAFLIPWEKGDTETLIAFYFEEGEGWFTVNYICLCRKREKFVAICLCKEREKRAKTTRWQMTWQRVESDGKGEKEDVMWNINYPKHTIITILDRKGGEKGKADRYRC